MNIRNSRHIDLQSNDWSVLAGSFDSPSALQCLWVDLGGLVLNLVLAGVVSSVRAPTPAKGAFMA